MVIRVDLTDRRESGFAAFPEQRARHRHDHFDFNRTGGFSTWVTSSIRLILGGAVDLAQ